MESIPNWPKTSSLLASTSRSMMMPSSLQMTSKPTSLWPKMTLAKKEAKPSSKDWGPWIPQAKMNGSMKTPQPTPTISMKNSSKISLSWSQAKSASIWSTDGMKSAKKQTFLTTISLDVVFMPLHTFPSELNTNTKKLTKRTNRSLKFGKFQVWTCSKHLKKKILQRPKNLCSWVLSWVLIW